MTPEVRDRMNYELDVINKMGFPSYFLIVWDYVKFARDHDIPVGPGRGSAAGSVVAYLLGITGLDPLKYDLLFERFLNPERVTMPDIDMDFCYENRGRIIDYVTRKYGKEHVALIITFGTLAARAVMRDGQPGLGDSSRRSQPLYEARADGIGPDYRPGSADQQGIPPGIRDEQHDSSHGRSEPRP